MSALPPHAYAAALAALPPLNVHRLGALLRHHPPYDAWLVVTGELPACGPMARVLADPKTAASVRAAAARTDPTAVWRRCAQLGISVLVHGDERYPALLADDPLPPPVLFAKGSLDLLEGRRVGIVGTRNATAAGREAARSIAAGLASSGVHVVSGLARGIDGCAHAAVVAAEGEGRPIAVVASGLDVVYPREHRDLWAAAANCGLLLSESPPGTEPHPWRFPLRNRIVAALSEVVVVVESREKGGSLITAGEALDRGVPVMAVPGSPGNRAATGTNALLRDGAAPAVDAGDVLDVLAMEHGRLATLARADLRRRPDDSDLPIYQALQPEPRTIEGLTLCTGRPLAAVAWSLARLEVAGWVAQADGWFEAVGSPLR